MQNLDKLIGQVMNWQHWDALIDIGAAAMVLYVIFFLIFFAVVMSFIYGVWKSMRANERKLWKDYKRKK